MIFNSPIKIHPDQFPTPWSAFKVLLPFIRGITVNNVVFWEPACGDKRLIEWIKAEGYNIDGGDIVATPATLSYNYLVDDTRRNFVITNPPFTQAFEFCVHARKYSDNTLLLLRLNFLASKKRAAWWRENEPTALLVLTHRPSFTGNGKTDSTDYAWFYWGTLLGLEGIYHV